MKLTKPVAYKHALVATSSLHPNPKNVRRHSAKQIAKLCAVIKAYGFASPIVADETGMILAGHGRYEAAKRLEMAEVPCITLPGLTEHQKAAFAIADNKLGDESEFDETGLNALLRELADGGFDMELTGFDMGELDFRLDGPAGGMMGDADDLFDASNQPAASREGDVWKLGPHRITCGSALTDVSYQAVHGSTLADMVFTDPPYNCAVDGFVSGLGKIKHREFAMASGEMSSSEFKDFLETYMRHAAAFSADGSIHFHCMDWRNAHALQAVGEGVYGPLKNLCVWIKTNAGMGSLYRSQHELVLVFKKGSAPHCNNVELGKNGRHRSNVWEYPGANTFSRTRKADLAAHPTVKPVAMVADAIRDVTKRGGLVLDPFLGSGTTLLAAERSGRVCAGIEIDPLYVDTAIRRWTKLTRKQAILADDDRTFDEVARDRAAETLEAAQ